MTDKPALLAKFQEFLGPEAPRYQSLDLGGGVITEGADRSYLNKFVFSSDMTGKSLFDIGCSLGYFCLEAVRRGAYEAIGMETSPERVRHARKIAEFCNLPVTYIMADFEDWENPEFRADVVLCLNVIHHLYDPLGALRKMMRIARERVVLEVAVVNFKEMRKLKRGWTVPGLAAAPVILLQQPRHLLKVCDRTYLFTQSSLKTVFNTHTKTFEPVRFYPSPFKGRLIVEARKRKIGKLVVVGGPTSVGKSTFCKKLTADEDFSSRFGINRRDAIFIDARQVDQLPSGPLDTVILHYDMLRPYNRAIQSHGRDPVFHLLTCSENVSVITLVNTPAQLQNRIVEGYKTENQNKRRLLLKNQYQNPDFLISWYTAWLDAVDTITKKIVTQHFVVSSKEYSSISKDEALALIT